jgi:hypothetical protein
MKLEQPNACISAAATRHSLKNDLKVPNPTLKTSESEPSAANALLGGDPGLKPPPIPQSTQPYVFTRSGELLDGCYGLKPRLIARLTL